MKTIFSFLPVLAIICFWGCQGGGGQANDAAVQQDSVVSLAYQSDSLRVQLVAPNTYVHESFLQTQSFGLVGCNGMIVVSGNEAVIFDTPTTRGSSQELIRHLTAKGISIRAVVPTHFHADCAAGLADFHAAGVASYAHQPTIERLEGERPQNGFREKLELSVGGKPVEVVFLGEGHTADNVVAYFPEDRTLFGGCLVKEVGATKGYLGDANVATWSETARKVKATFAQAQVVVPGHGKHGGTELLDYTAQLFDPDAAKQP